MSNDQHEERRLYHFVRKYIKIVKQFDELVELIDSMNKRTKKHPKSSGESSNEEANEKEVLVQTITRFLHELRAEDDSVTPPDDSPPTTQNRN